MRKPKIYLDTSVISHLKQDDVPDKMSDTLKLWEEIKQEKYEVYISETTLKELRDCSEPKHSIMFDFLAQIKYYEINTTHEIETLAQAIIDNGILTAKSYDDCLHIGAALVYGCTYIVSWNFKHMVNVRTIKGIRAITVTDDYPNIDIITPTMLIESEE